MSPSTPEEQANVDAAELTLRSIESLDNHAGFAQFIERKVREIEEMANLILEGEMTVEQREIMRLKRLGKVEFLRSIEEDREACRSVLARYDRA